MVKDTKKYILEDKYQNINKSLKVRYMASTKFFDSNDL